MAETLLRPGNLDPAPLLSYLERRGEMALVHRSSLRRWRRNGIELWRADQFCIRNGIHPYEIWGNDFYRGCGEKRGA